MIVSKIIKHKIEKGIGRQYEQRHQIDDRRRSSVTVPIKLPVQSHRAVKAERKICRAGSILTYTNKTLKQHWEEYIGNEDPGQVLNEIYTPLVVREKEGHVRCIPSNLPRRRICLNKIRLRELNRQKTLVLIRTKKFNRKAELLELFLGESISLPFGYKADRLGKIKKDERVYDAESKTNTTEQFKNAVIYCCLRLSMVLCCVGMDDEVEHVEIQRVRQTEKIELERLEVGEEEGGEEELVQEIAGGTNEERCEDQ